MIDHVGLKVKDFEKSKAFYEAALKPLGYTIVHSFPGAVGMGGKGPVDIWISKGEPLSKIHIAFQAEDRPTVEAFHAAALEAGGKDNGPPGLRPKYHPQYFAAFIHDLDGNNIEVVCHYPD